jgi:NADH dehydrogenase (ubiquinone) 1 beta subcomplex subunit 7
MDPPTLKASPEEMAANNLPMHVRDYCADVLIPLNKCRRKEMYAPWACHDLMHSYEICMYKEYERRRAIKKDA